MRQTSVLYPLDAVHERAHLLPKTRSARRLAVRLLAALALHLALVAWLLNNPTNTSPTNVNRTELPGHCPMARASALGCRAHGALRQLFLLWHNTRCAGNMVPLESAENCVHTLTSTSLPVSMCMHLCAWRVKPPCAVKRSSDPQVAHTVS